MRTVKDAQGGQADLLAEIEVVSPLRVGGVISFADACHATRRRQALRRLIASSGKKHPDGGGNAA
jgi:hypothetical protein